MGDLTLCLECGKHAAPVTGERVYPHRPDLHHKRFYLCDCGAYVGAHRDNGTPLGHPVGAEGRKARMAAHEAFDPLWRSGGMKRSDAYKWLAEKLGTSPAKTHISWMTADQAKRVADLCREAK